MAEVEGTKGCGVPCCPSSPSQPRLADELAPAGSSRCLDGRASCLGVHARADAVRAAPVLSRADPHSIAAADRGIHADAFAGYDALYRAIPDSAARIQHAACWAHARRELFEVHESTRSPIAEEALWRVQALYQIEAEIIGQPALERLAQRQARSKPLLAELRTRMQAQRRRASGKTVLGKALQYALTRWEALTRYVEDGRLAIHNNLAERLLRGIAISRKNFLFVGSDAGGDREAILYTLIETAKLNGLNPEAYLAYVFDQLARGHLTTRLAELLPWNCKDRVSA